LNSHDAFHVHFALQYCYPVGEVALERVNPLVDFREEADRFWGEENWDKIFVNKILDLNFVERNFLQENL
jgi:hypothetical protein